MLFAWLWLGSMNGDWICQTRWQWGSRMFYVKNGSTHKSGMLLGYVTGLLWCVGTNMAREEQPQSLWCQDMEMFSTLLAIWEVNPPVTGGFSSQRTSDVECWCFICCLAVEQTVNFPVIWDAISLSTTLRPKLCICFDIRLWNVVTTDYLAGGLASSWVYGFQCSCNKRNFNGWVDSLWLFHGRCSNLSQCIVSS